MKMSDWVFQLMLLLPISLVSAAAVSSVFVPRVGAVEVEGQLVGDMSHKEKTNQKFNIERIVQSQWEKQRRWAILYKQSKRKLHHARIAKLGFVSLGAVAQVAATQVPPQYKVTTSFVGGVFIGIGAYLKNHYITKDQVNDMVTSFYVSQALKSEVSKFRARVGPYKQVTGTKAATELKNKCKNISNIGTDKRFYQMQKDKKPVPGVMDTKYDYIENRLDKVINNLYIKNARQMERKGVFLSKVEDLLLTTGTLAGFAATQQFPAFIQKYIDGVMGWTGALTTISAGFANHHAKMKYEEISNQYYDAANQLRNLADDWPNEAMKAGDPGWDLHIQKCENIILSTVEEFARDRTGNKDIAFKMKKASPKDKFQKKVWNGNVVVGSDETGDFLAKDRMKYLMENESLSKTEAQNKIMSEYPDNF
jgi:hypothetical protein